MYENIYKKDNKWHPINLHMQIKKTIPRNGTQIEQNNTFLQVKQNSLTTIRKHPLPTVPLPDTNATSTYIIDHSSIQN